MRHKYDMRDSLPLPYASSSASTLDKDNDSSMSHKSWTIQRLYLQFRRQHILVQLLFVLVGIYLLSWSTSFVVSIFTSPSEDPQDIFDAAIVVLGGGLTAAGTLPPHTQLRVDEAIRLYRSLGGRARIITLSGGTPYKPNPLDAKGFPILEATAAARELLHRGIPANHVFEEAFSLDTIGNAYWLRSIHIHPGRYRDLYVITNDWHMPRTQAIFTTVFALPDIDPRKQRSKAAATAGDYDSFWVHQWMYRALYGLLSSVDLDAAVDDSVRLHFVPVPPGIEDASILKIRREKEQKSLVGFLTHVAPHWATWYDLHVWLFAEHNAYASKRLLTDADPAKAKPLSPEEQLLLKTY